MKINKIIRDFGGVFVDENKGSISNSISKIFGVTQESLDPYLSHLRSLFRNWTISEDVFFSKLSLNLWGQNLYIPDRFWEDLQFGNNEIRRDMFKLLATLKKSWLTNILLSDTYPPIKEIVKQKWMYSLFDHLYLSCEVWFSKYDDVVNSTCFSIMNVINDLHISHNETIFIDDRIENCLIARRAWIRYIHAQDPSTTILLMKNIFSV